MTLASRSLCALACAAAASAGLAVVHSALPGGVRLDALGMGGSPTGGPQSLELRCGDPESLARITAKGEVIRRLIDGRVTLGEAAAWFRTLNRPSAAGGRDFTADFPGATEEERLCRQAIAWAKSKARVSSASREEAVGRRLEAEFAQLQSRDGVVRLPEE
jgi:hypothetical protein